MNSSVATTSLAALLLILPAGWACADQWFSEEKHMAWTSGVLMTDDYIAKCVRIFSPSDDGTAFLIEFKNGTAKVLMIGRQDAASAVPPEERCTGVLILDGTREIPLRFLRETQGGQTMTTFAGIEYKPFIESLLHAQKMEFRIDAAKKNESRTFSLEGFKPAYEKGLKLLKKMERNPAYGIARTDSALRNSRATETNAGENGGKKR